MFVLSSKDLRYCICECFCFSIMLCLGLSGFCALRIRGQAAHNFCHMGWGHSNLLFSCLSYKNTWGIFLSFCSPQPNLTHLVMQSLFYKLFTWDYFVQFWGSYIRGLGTLATLSVWVPNPFSFFPMFFCAKKNEKGWDLYPLNNSRQINKQKKKKSPLWVFAVVLISNPQYFKTPHR